MSDMFANKNQAHRIDAVRASFEFFPAKTDDASDRLIETVKRLAIYEPAFVSVTYGAGGSTRDRTLDTLTRIAAETDLSVAGHLTCVDATRAQVDAAIDAYAAAGIRRIVALRGDPREGVGAKYVPPVAGYRNAADLVAGIKARGDFDISVSAYPEKHPESADFDADLDMLAAKADAGADRALTQFFFNTDHFYRYLDRVAARGISIPIVPGIMPIGNFTQVSRFAAACGTEVPSDLKRRFDDQDDDDARFATSVAVASEQVIDLYDNGVRQFHFYTMNKSPLVAAVLEALADHRRGERLDIAAA